MKAEFGKFYSYLFNMRQTGDYDVFIDFDRVGVISLLSPAKELIEAIQKLLSIL